ncbi:MAG: dTDP-4-dehydrorhamnose 3,5-epimerase [Candidatus Riflebacteria bacterium]|nr:dTDP-4-dehydrorhamnose 3,5-epimerase [Candidatus Riflebacteria bacterium]
MKIERLTIPDVMLITPKVFEDSRGFFMETWNYREYSNNGLDQMFLQDNHSKSKFGTLRGLHYQIKNTQSKLVRVTLGTIFDVAVDLRKSSPFFGKWTSSMLSSDNSQQLWIPAGFAHGFLVLSESAEIQYKCTDYYDPTAERCIAWNDPDLAIEWPLSQPPLLSEKDKNGGLFREAEVFE